MPSNEESEQFKPSLEQAVGFLRQWLNEDRISDPARMVTSEEIMHWLKDGLRADRRKLLEGVLAALPAGRKPSDPEFNNKSHAPNPADYGVVGTYQDEFGEEMPIVKMAPNSVRTLPTPNDGFNEALDQVRSIIEQKIKEG